MAVHICFHNHCFDGAVSAALFGRFYRDRIDPKAELRFFGLTHRNGGGMERSLLEAEASAILDFGFENTPSLTWWFDHHQSAFLSEEDQSAFEKDASGKKFFDPKAPSCAGFLAKVLQERFGYEAESFRETLYWADLIDAARFPDAASAIAVDTPALQLMTVIQGNHDPLFLPRVIQDISQKTLSEVAQLDYVKAPLAPILAKNQKVKELTTANGRCEGGVSIFDLTQTTADFFPKFLAYYLYPEARYSVGFVKEPTRFKISVGSNPWASQKRTHNISEICARYGGGGHPVVGAISLPSAQEKRAREIFLEIIKTLQTG